MPVILKSPGAPLFAKKANGGYELYQGFAGLGAHVMASPVRHAGVPGVWTAQEIGPDGQHGRERFIHRDLAVPIGGGQPRNFSQYMTDPIDKPLSGISGSTMPWLVRLALGFAGAAVLAAVLGKRRMTRNGPIVRQQIDDTSWAIYWQQPGTDRADASYIGMVVAQDEGAYPFFAQAVSGATGTHEDLSSAEHWLVKHTWRVVPGEKR
jgi:hypothetical protein